MNKQQKPSEQAKRAGGRAKVYAFPAPVARPPLLPPAGFLLLGVVVGWVCVGLWMTNSLPELLAFLVGA